MATNRAEGLARMLAKPDFDSINFVNKLSQGGEDDLLEMKQSIQVLSDDTAQSLKKNVYKNYSQFIETAKEISILEGEMYQLSHMLSEQMNIMTSLMDCSVAGNIAAVQPPADREQVNPEMDTRKNLAFLLEKVEGCASIADVPGRTLIHNGDLIEIDPETYTHIQRVHAFLLNDSLMIAVWLPNRRGLVRYRFQGLYELDSLAMVNVRDVGSIKNAFKILMFPDTRMYQCDCTKSKRQWLDILEETKKAKATKDRQKKDLTTSLKEKQTAVVSNPILSQKSSESVESTVDLLAADWLQELPEDLDMCIAQRDFEGAVDLIEKVNGYLKNCPKTASIKEYRARIDYRIKQLTEGLVGELQVTSERLIRGGPRAARRAVSLLIRLGKSAQACDLFLKERSSIIKYNIRQLKIEGATTLYIKHLCNVFFSSIHDSGREFFKAFSQHYSCYSSFVVWARKELISFIVVFKRQVFGSRANLSVIAECVSFARENCSKLTEIGLDFEFLLDSILLPDIERVIVDAQSQSVDTLKYRCKNDIWNPMNHLNTLACDKFIEELKVYGLESVKNYIFDESFISLTMNTVIFAKSILSLVDDVLRFNLPQLQPLIVETIVKLFQHEILHIENALRSDQFSTEHEFILKNAQFVCDTVILRIKERFLKASLPIPKDVARLAVELSRLKSLANNI